MENNKSPVKIYLKCVLIALYLLVSFGWLLPFLISSDTNELPILGVVYLISMPVVLFYSIKNVINNLKQFRTNEKV